MVISKECVGTQLGRTAVNGDHAVMTLVLAAASTVTDESVHVQPKLLLLFLCSVTNTLSNVRQTQTTGSISPGLLGYQQRIEELTNLDLDTKSNNCW